MRVLRGAALQLRYNFINKRMNKFLINCLDLSELSNHFWLAHTRSVQKETACFSLYVSRWKTTQSGTLVLPNISAIKSVLLSLGLHTNISIPSLSMLLFLRLRKSPYYELVASENINFFTSFVYSTTYFDKSKNYSSNNVKIIFFFNIYLVGKSV